MRKFIIITIVFLLTVLVNPLGVFANEIIPTYKIMAPSPGAFSYGYSTLGYNGIDNGDFNNDGYVDIVLVNCYSSYLGNNTGIVAILLGNETNTWDIDWVIYGEGAGQWLGYWNGVTVGNFNGDEFDDVAIGAPGNSEGGSWARKVYVFFGKETLPSGYTNVNTADVTALGDTTNKLLFGSVLGTSDVNGDNIDDLFVLQAGGDSYNNPYTYGYLGSTSFSISTEDFIINAPVNTQVFGFYAVEGGGDFNNDGYKDLIIADSYDISSSTKKAYLYWGGEPFDTTFDVTFTPESLGTTEVFARDSSTAVGDINNDGIDDLCIGSNSNDVSFLNAGALYCWFGGDSWSGDMLAVNADIIIRGQEEGDNFGRSCDIRDVNNDLWNDIIVTSYELEELLGQDHGIVYIYLNNNGTIDPNVYWIRYTDNSWGRELGSSIKVFDYNQDGWQDFVLHNASNNLFESMVSFFDLSHGDVEINIDEFAKYDYDTPQITGRALNNSNEVTYNETEIILKPSLGSDWDTVHTGYSPSILKEDDTYKMWYSGKSNVFYIGYATSSDGISWTRNVGNNCSGTTGDGCVLSRGITNSWDDGEVYSSSVLWDEDAMVYKMWYQGSDGSRSRLGYATSSDGINWLKYDNVSSPACGFSEALDDGCVFNFGSANTWDDYHVGYPRVIRVSSSSYIMYYAGNDGSLWRIGYATSTDGINWTRNPGNLCASTTGVGCIINIGSSGSSDDNGILPSNVIFEGGIYKIWYSGNDGDKWEIFYAYSSDGINFSKYSASPVLSVSTDNLSPDLRNVFLPVILFEDSEYKMWYTGSNSNHFLSYASSNDGINWNKRISEFSSIYNKNIANVQWSFNNDIIGDWNECIPTDGLFDSNNEEFECSITQLPDGEHTIYIRYIDEDNLFIPQQYYRMYTFNIDTIDELPETGENSKVFILGYLLLLILLAKYTIKRKL